MATLFDSIDVTVEAAFGDDPLDTSPSWTDISTYVRDLSISRGRNSEFTPYAPGIATIRLDNRDRRFDPEYTLGPYYGDLVPMVPVRIITTYSGSTYTLYYGYAQGWPTAYNTANTDAVAIINCVDGNRFLGNTSLATSAIAQQILDSNPSFYWPFQEQITYTDGRLRTFDVVTGEYMFGGFVEKRDIDGGFPTGAPIANTSFTSWTYYPGDTYFSPSEADMPSILSGEFFFDARVTGTSSRTFSVGIDRDKTSPGDYRIDVQLAWDTTNNWYVTLINFQSNELNLHGTDGTNVTFTPFDGMSHCVFSVQGTTFKVFIDGTLVTSVALTSGSTFATASQIVFTGSSVAGDPIGKSHLALYTTELSDADVANHFDAKDGHTGELSSARLARTLDDADWPASWRDIETGVQTVGAYRPARLAARNYSEQIQVAEQGDLFVNRSGEVAFVNRSTTESANIVALFDDDSVDYPFTLVEVDANTVDAIRNSIAVSYATDTVIVEDSTSVTAYGRAQDILDARLIDDPITAETIGNVVLAKTKDPRTRIRSLEINVRTDPTMVPTVAQLELADDVVVSFTPTGVGDALWRAVRVQGVSHRITANGWVCRLYLAPGPYGANGPLFVLNDDTYGELDAGNKLG